GLKCGIPQWYQHEGFAKNLKTAHWLFSFCGWKSQHSPYPALSYEVEEGELNEDYYIPCDLTEQWVLGSCLYLN
uniref:hypothetical protein n=1 Tax=Spirosoma luteum TaxID=431553 RepID=UPI001B7FC4D3